MKTQQHSHFSPDLEMQVSRFGLRVASSLSEHNRSLPHGVSERLRFAREKALIQARDARTAQLVSASGTQSVRAGSALALTGLNGSSQGWFKLASFLPLLMLVAGLLLIDHSQWYEQISATAEIDTALLSDHLPPAAYGDPGFSEYLVDEQE